MSASDPDLDGAVATIDPEKPGRIRGRYFHEPLGRDLPRVHAFRVQHGAIHLKVVQVPARLFATICVESSLRHSRTFVIAANGMHSPFREAFPERVLILLLRSGGSPM